jgi:F-type H+-transporting ATPase subunit c
MKKITGLILFLGVLFVAAPAAFAAEEGAASDPMANSVLAIACVIGVGLAAGGCGIGMGNATNGAVNAMARNPGFYNKIFMNMIIGLALIEALAIYTLVMAFLFMFA